jgi:aryl-alcohol dehydrogenase (NADP+)
MDYVRLGQSGLLVSRICLGAMSYGSKAWRSWVLEEPESVPFIRHAWEKGVTFFDTADMYSKGRSEEILGRALKALGPREEQVVATKVFFPHSTRPNRGGLSRKHVFAAIDSSLRRLGMDYVDLYVIHRWDYATPIEETMETLHDVVRAGKARYIGASSMYAWQFAKAQHTAERNGWTRFISMQNHYNLVYREEEREMLPLCRDMGVGVTPWSPLARGFLAGNRRLDAGTKTGETLRAQTDEFAHSLYYAPSDFEIARRCVELAEKRGVHAAQIALAWLLAQPGVTAPIIGATKMHQLDDALGALDITLADDERAYLEEPYMPHEILGHE